MLAALVKGDLSSSPDEVYRTILMQLSHGGLSVTLGELTEPLMPLCESVLRYVHKGLNHGSQSGGPASKAAESSPSIPSVTLAAAYAAIVSTEAVTALSSEIKLLLEHVQGHHCGQWPHDVAKTFTLDALHLLRPVLSRLPPGFRLLIASNTEFYSKYPEDADDLRSKGTDGHDPDKAEEIVMEEDAESLKETADISLPFQPDTDTRRNVKTKLQAQVFQNRESVRDQFFELLRQFRKVYYYSVDASNISEFESQFSTRVRAIAADVLPDNWEFFSTLFLHELLLLGATTVTSTEMDPTVRQLVRDHKKLQGLHTRITRRSNNGFASSNARRSPEPRSTASRKQPTKVTRSPGTPQESVATTSPQQQHAVTRSEMERGPRSMKRHLAPVALTAGSVTAAPAFQLGNITTSTSSASGGGDASRAALMATKPSPTAWAVPLFPKPAPSATPQPPSLLSSATMSLPPPPPANMASQPIAEAKPPPHSDEPDTGVVSWLCDSRFPGVQKFFFAFLRVADCQSLNALLLRKLTAVVIQTIENSSSITERDVFRHCAKLRVVGRFMAMLTFYPRWSATATSEFGKFEQLPVDFGGVLAAGIHAKCLVLVLPWLSEVLLLVDATSLRSAAFLRILAVLRDVQRRLCRRLQASALATASSTLSACELTCVIQLETMFLSIGEDPRSSPNEPFTEVETGVLVTGLDDKHGLIGSQFLAQCSPSLQSTLSDAVKGKSSGPSSVPKPRDKLQRLEVSHSTKTLSVDPATAVQVLSASFLHHHPQQKILVETIGRTLAEELATSAVQACVTDAMQATTEHFSGFRPSVDGADATQFASHAVEVLSHLAMLRIQHEAALRTKAIYSSFVVEDAPTTPVWTTTATITAQFVLKEAERQLHPIVQAAIKKETSK